MNTARLILISTGQLTVNVDFHKEKNTMEFNGCSQLSDYHLQNLFFCVQKKK